MTLGLLDKWVIVLGGGQAIVAPENALKAPLKAHVEAPFEAPFEAHFEAHLELRGFPR
ncbi:hypothetical protein FHR88_006849 [Bradyrhizobium betae]|nr:hypothetical protein [Bradyrhizobium betae]